MATATGMPQPDCWACAVSVAAMATLLMQPTGVTYARGMVFVEAAELRQVVGRHTSDLPVGMAHEVIHRDDPGAAPGLVAAGLGFLAHRIRTRSSNELTFVPRTKGSAMRFGRALGAVATVGVTGALAMPATSSAERTCFTFVTLMSGAEEAPGPGDPDGRGVAVIRVNTATDEICYHLVAQRIEPATMAHIHVGDAGDPGPIVQGLNPPTDRTSKGCVVNVLVADDLVENPSDYYVNVHNFPFPGGAIRGQLG